MIYAHGFEQIIRFSYPFIPITKKSRTLTLKSLCLKLVKLTITRAAFENFKNQPSS